MSDSDSMGVTRCGNCKEHSGVTTMLANHSEIIKELRDHAKESNKRWYQILIGIILCLITGLVSIGLIQTRMPIRERYNVPYQVNSLVNLPIHKETEPYGFKF